MSDNPAFSVVVPTYQRRDSVQSAVEALCAVEYDGEIELIVVVDGSTDGTEDALDAMACPFPKRIVAQANRGAAAARNRGAAEARGEILLFLDDDMLCQRDVVRKHAESYRAGADAVIGDFPLDPGSPDGFLSDWIGKLAHWDRGDRPLTAFDIFTGHLSVRRSVFEALGGFDDRFTADGNYGNEDIDFGARLLAHYDVRYNPQAIARQRSSVTPSEYMRRARSLAKADIRFAAKHPGLADELFAIRGAGRTSNRLRLLSRVPLMAGALGIVAVSAARVALKTPLRSNRNLKHFFIGAWLVNYWSAVRSERLKSSGVA